MFVSLYNSICFAIAMSMIQSMFINRRSARHILTSCAVIVLEINLGVSYLNLLYYVVISTVILYKKHEFCLSVYASLTAVFLLYIGAIVVSIPVLYFFPSFHGSNAYNYIFGVIILLGSHIAKSFNDRRKRPQPSEKAAQLLIFIEALLLVLYSFIFPRFVTGLLEYPQNLALVYLIFLAFSIPVTIALFRLNSIDLENRELILKEKHNREVDKLVKQQYDYAQSIEHFYKKLYELCKNLLSEGKIDELQNFFEEYIAPQQTTRAFDNALGKLKSDLLTLLLQNMLGIIAAQEKIEIQLEILGDINIPKEFERDVFSLLTEYIANSIKELEKQEQGLFVLKILALGADQLEVVVKNSIADDKMSYNSQARDEHSGHGLALVQDILQNMPVEASYTIIGEHKPTGTKCFIQQVIWDWSK